MSGKRRNRKRKLSRDTDLSASEPVTKKRSKPKSVPKNKEWFGEFKTKGHNRFGYISTKGSQTNEKLRKKKAAAAKSLKSEYCVHTQIVDATLSNIEMDSKYLTPCIGMCDTPVDIPNDYRMIQCSVDVARLLLSKAQSSDNDHPFCHMTFAVSENNAAMDKSILCIKANNDNTFKKNLSPSSDNCRITAMETCKISVCNGALYCVISGGASVDAKTVWIGTGITYSSQNPQWFPTIVTLKKYVGYPSLQLYYRPDFKGSVTVTAAMVDGDKQPLTIFTLDTLNTATTMTTTTTTTSTTSTTTTTQSDDESETETVDHTSAIGTSAQSEGDSDGPTASVSTHEPQMIFDDDTDDEQSQPIVDTAIAPIVSIPPHIAINTRAATLTDNALYRSISYDHNGGTPTDITSVDNPIFQSVSYGMAPKNIDQMLSESEVFDGAMRRSQSGNSRGKDTAIDSLPHFAPPPLLNHTLTQPSNQCGTEPSWFSPSANHWNTSNSSALNLFPVLTPFLSHQFNPSVMGNAANTVSTSLTYPSVYQDSIQSGLETGAMSSGGKPRRNIRFYHHQNHSTINDISTETVSNTDAKVLSDTDAKSISDAVPNIPLPNLNEHY